DQDSNHALPPAGVHILQLDAFSAYLPLGLSMELVSKSNTPLPRRMYDRSEDVFVRLKTEDAYPSGEFWIWTEHHDTDHVERHGPIPATSGEIDIAVPSLYLPGKIILTVDYVSEGHRWLSDSWELSGGWLRVNFS